MSNMAQLYIKRLVLTSLLALMEISTIEISFFVIHSE